MSRAPDRPAPAAARPWRRRPSAGSRPEDEDAGAAGAAAACASRPAASGRLVPASATSSSSRATDGQSASSRERLGRPVGRDRGAVDHRGCPRPLPARAIASHSSAASDSAERRRRPPWRAPGPASTASSGRASQISLQREQRTVRPAGPKVCQLDGVGCCTMGANDVHGAQIPRMKPPKCYKATVNESETITEAQRFYSVRCRPGRRRARGFEVPGLRFPAAAHVERS